MSNYIRQAQVGGVWGPVPDRRELLRQGVVPKPISSATIIAELSKTAIDMSAVTTPPTDPERQDPSK